MARGVSGPLNGYQGDNSHRMGLRSLLLRLGLLKLKANLLVLGLANSGKTSIVNLLLPGNEQDVSPTVGFSVESCTLHGCKLTVLDMSGQSRYQQLWEMHYQDAHALVFVVDAAGGLELMQLAQAALHAVAHHPDVKGKPMLVLANKMDLAGTVQAHQVATALQLPQLPQHTSFQISTCSAKQNTGIAEGMRWLLSVLKSAA